MPQQIPGHSKVQVGDSRIHTSIPQEEQISRLYRPHGCPPTHTQVLPQRCHQFTSLPFGLATAPLISTSVVKEVRLLALQQGICIHQYLDDWLIHAPSREEYHEQLLNLVRDLGWIENSDLVQSQQCHTQSETRTRVTQCDSGRPLQEESNPVHRVVPISTDLQVFKI